MTRAIVPFALTLLLLPGCGDEPRPDDPDAPAPLAMASQPTACDVVTGGIALPDQVPESSGLARSSRRPDRFWTHNDAGGNRELFAIDEGGALRGRIRVGGARVVDWEDIAAAPCNGGSCLYIGDIGDNDGDRSGITVYRIAEPTAGTTTAAATAIHARYPQGSPDAEALFAHQGRLYLVTKGRRSPIRLYRFPEGGSSGATAGTLELITELAPEPESERDMVTAAGASPDGQWVGIRTYRTLLIYPAAELLSGQVPQPIRHDLSELREPQGEAVALGPAGEVWLTTESDGGQDPAISGLTCNLESSGAASG